MFPKLPKKVIAIIQVWVSLTLVMLALIMSFLPIVNINITSDIKEDLSEFLSEEGAEINLDAIPDKVSVTAPKLISSIIFFADIASSMMDDSNPNAAYEYDMGYSAGREAGYNAGLSASGNYHDYQHGYSEDYNAGYSQGFNNGYSEGYSARDGYYNDGRESGYNEGYSDGYNGNSYDSYSSNYNAAYNEGYRYGYDEGYNKGQSARNAYRNGYDAGYYGNSNYYSGEYYSEYNNGYNEGRNDKYYGYYYDNNPSSSSYYSNLSYSAVDYDIYDKVYGDIYGDDITIGSMPSYETEEEDISAILEDPSNQDKLLTAFAFASVFMDITEDDSNELSMIFNAVISMMSLLYIIAMTLVFPIILLIQAIITLVVALTNLKTPEKAAPKLSSKLTGLLTMLLMVMLFQCAVPQLSYGGGALGMLIVTLISIVLNAFAVRVPAYRKSDMKFANIVQAISLGGIVGFGIFFFSIIKSGVLAMFLKGPFFAFAERFEDISHSHYSAESNYLIDVILMVLYIAFAITAVSYIAKVTRRFSLATKKPSHLLAYPILALPVFVLPTVIMVCKNLNVTIGGTDYIIPQSSLVLTESQTTAHILVLVGIVIMLAAEICYIVLPKVLCKDMTQEDKLLVLSGKAPDPNAPVEALATEAVADENAATENTADQPATDAIADEATIDEPVADEAIIDEPVADEATDENSAE